jgi:hypothetical protein
MSRSSYNGYSKIVNRFVWESLWAGVIVGIGITLAFQHYIMRMW